MNPQIFSRIGTQLSLYTGIILGVLVWGCSEDMREQPSFSYQESPRRHSPQGSVPQVDLTAFRKSLRQHDPGAYLFSINCAHCHGPEGMGDGPVAGYLPELPANLQAPAVQKKADDVLYGIVTDGKDVMPAFEKLLTHEERRDLVSFIRSLPDPRQSSTQRPPGSVQKKGMF